MYHAELAFHAGCEHASHPSASLLSHKLTRDRRRMRHRSADSSGGTGATRRAPPVPGGMVTQRCSPRRAVAAHRKFPPTACHVACRPRQTVAQSASQSTAAYSRSRRDCPARFPRHVRPDERGTADEADLLDRGRSALRTSRRIGCAGLGCLPRSLQLLCHFLLGELLRRLRRAFRLFACRTLLRDIVLRRHGPLGTAVDIGDGIVRQSMSADLLARRHSSNTWMYSLR